MKHVFGEKEQERLRRLLESGFAAPKRFPKLQELCDDAKAHFDVDVAAVTLLTEDLLLLKAGAGIDVDPLPRNVAFCNYTILQDEVFVAPDTKLDVRFKDNPLTTGSPFIRFYAGAPLIYLQGIRLGSFCLLHSKPREFSLGNRAELADFAERAMSVMVACLLPQR